MATRSSSLLKDVVAYVDVWSSDKTANYSKPFIQQLQDMGAQVAKTFNKQVTHVVFNYGHPATWRKAKRGNVKLVSVLWVSRCHEEAVKVDEDLFPALNDNNPVLRNKKHRCMQPKDSPETTPENDKRLRKKLDKMMKDIIPQAPLVTDVSPIIIDEENGIVYSPGLKRSDYMARRLKDMKDKRENISPTASQRMDSHSELKPTLGDSPSIFKFTCEQNNLQVSRKVIENEQSDDDSSAFGAEAELFPAEEEGTSLSCPKENCHQRLIKDGTEPCSAEFRKQHFSPVQYLYFEENEDKSQKQPDANNPMLLSATHDSDTTVKKANRRKDRSSTVKSMSLLSNELNPQSHSYDNKEGKETKRAENSKMKMLDPHKNVKSPTSAAEGGFSIKTTPSIVEEKTSCEQPSIFAVLAQGSCLPSESPKTVLSPTDDVFEDYFFPRSLEQKTQTPFTSCLSGKAFQLPFELDTAKKKSKARRSKTTATAATIAGKIIKQEEIGSHLTDLDIGDVSERHSQMETVQLSDPCSSSEDFKQLPRKRRRRVLPFTDARVSSTRSQRLSLALESTKSKKTATAFQMHRKSDPILQSCSLTSGGNEHTEAAGLLETASEELNKASSLQTMVQKTKVGRTLVMTSLPTDKQSTVLQVVKTFGGFTVVDEVCESTTHVVSGGHRRTLNILLGIARGCWILSFEWVLWSLEKGHWVPEEPYELSEHFPSAQICRLQKHLSAGEHQQDLFQDQPVMFVSQQSQPPTRSLIELIQLCGGRVCRTVRQAGLCIGKYGGRRPEGTRAVSEQWVLDCITHLKQLPYDDYTLD